VVAPERGDVLWRTADLMDARADEIARDLSREEGKTKAESLREVALGARIFRYFAAQTLDPDGETFPSHQRDMLLYRRSEPLGVTFTGATLVGRGIQTKAAAHGKRVQLELGGKNPAVVLADADLDLAAQQISVVVFGSTGQKCTATSRVIVEKSVAGELLGRL